MAGKVVRSDWAGQVPASGIIGLIQPSQIQGGGGGGGATDIGQLTAAGFPKGYIPFWNGSKFVPRIYPAIPAPSPPSNDIMPLNVPAVATRMMFNGGLPAGAFNDVWFQDFFDLKHYGATGNGTTDESGSLNSAINAINSNGGGLLYVPQGNYFVGSPPVEITAPCLILGDGAGISRFNFSGDGFVGGSGGDWFGAQGLSLLTDGTAGAALSITDGTSSYLTDGTAIPLSDGTNVGQLFGFNDLQIAGFSTGIHVGAPSRQGFIRGCRIFPRAIGMNLSCLGTEISDCIFVNAGSTAAIAAILGGDYHSMRGVKIFSGINNWASGVEMVSGSGFTLADMVVYGCNGAAIDLTGAGHGRVQNISFGGILGASPVVFTPEIHYVNELHGLGGNTNASYDLRKELSASVTWAPGTIRILESATIDVSVPGVDLSDQVFVGTPDATDYLQVSGRVVSDDTVRITLTNVSMNVITLPSATYKVRAAN